MTSMLTLMEKMGVILDARRVQSPTQLSTIGGTPDAMKSPTLVGFGASMESPSTITGISTLHRTACVPSAAKQLPAKTSSSIIAILQGAFVGYSAASAIGRSDYLRTILSAFDQRLIT